MANFPTSPATGSYFTTSGTTYEYVGPGIWQVAAPDSEVKMSVIQEDHTKLLLKFNEEADSTTFTDSSRKNRTITANGNTHIFASKISPIHPSLFVTPIPFFLYSVASFTTPNNVDKASGSFIRCPFPQSIKDAPHLTESSKLLAKGTTSS